MRSTRKYIALGMWLLAAVLFISLAAQWIAYSSSDKQLTEYVQNVLQRASLDRRPPKEVRNLVLMKAAQLSIPLRDEQLNVFGQGESIQTVIAYHTEIKVPVVDHVLYRMKFNHHLNARAIP